jgi:hypothetical protein
MISWYIKADFRDLIHSPIHLHPQAPLLTELCSIIRTMSLMHQTTMHQINTSINVRSAVGHTDFTEACQEVVDEWIQKNPFLTNNKQLVCGQRYNPSILPAVVVDVSLAECAQRWPGWQKSEFSELEQWLTPLVGMLLPALVFVLVIPRNYKVPRGEEYFHKHIIATLGWMLCLLCLLILDALVWIILAFGLAGPILVGAINEALKDWRILKSVDRSCTRAQASYALAITLLGTFKPREELKKPQNHDLVDNVINQICNTSNIREAKEKLRQLVAQKRSYGTQIGVPMVFNIIVFIFALPDANKRLGDHDTAYAVAFAIWYQFIPVIAASCCCVVGLDDPSLVEAVLRTPRPRKRPTMKSFFTPFESKHHSVWIFGRARCARIWADKKIMDISKPDNHKAIHKNVRKILNSKQLELLSCILGASMISIIYLLGFLVAYHTPQIGFGCQALTILCHGITQVLLIISWY